eukprot:sb/3475966/
MGMEQLLGTLQTIYSRDLQQLSNEKKGVESEVCNEKKGVESEVADLKASIVELKLTEVDNEFSTYPAALSLELRQLNNKLAMAEDQNSNLNKIDNDIMVLNQINLTEAFEHTLLHVFSNRQ